MSIKTPCSLTIPLLQKKGESTLPFGSGDVSGLINKLKI
jgi:hypothetical protein